MGRKRPQYSPQPANSYLEESEELLDELEERIKDLLLLESSRPLFAYMLGSDGSDKALLAKFLRALTAESRAWSIPPFDAASVEIYGEGELKVVFALKGVSRPSLEEVAILKGRLSQLNLLYSPMKGKLILQTDSSKTIKIAPPRASARLQDA